MSSLQKVLLILLYSLICEIDFIENREETCNLICGCEDDLIEVVKFNKHRINDRRGLFDPFPPDRGVNVSYIQSIRSLKLNPPVEVIFVFVNIGVAAILQQLTSTFASKLPYQAFILVIAMTAGILSKLFPNFDKFTLVANIKPMMIILLFLPSIVISTVFSVDYYIMKKCLKQIIIFGVVGFILRSFLIGMVISLMITQSLSDQWVLLFFICGSICAITQPKDAIGVLKKKGEFKHICTLLEAESLISLSLGIFFYNIAAFAVSDNSYKRIIWLFFLYSVGSIFLGLAVGWITFYLLKLVCAELYAFIFILVSIAYILYYVSQLVLCFCGIISLMAYLLVLHQNKSALSPTDEKLFLHITECFSFVSSTLMFSMSGIVVVETILLNVKMYRTPEIVCAVLVYFITYTIRAIVLFSLWPIMKRVSYDITWQSMLLVVFSGINGSFALCTALASNLKMDDAMYNSKFLLTVNVLVLTSGLINPPLLSWIITKIGLDRVDDAKVKNMTALLKDMGKGRAKTLLLLKGDQGYSEANWNVVESFTILKHPYPWAQDEASQDHWHQRRLSVISCPQCKQRDSEKRTSLDIDTEANQRLLQIKKVHYRRQYNERLLNIQELRALEALIDHASDTQNKVVGLQIMKDLWKESSNLLKFRKLICCIAFFFKDEYIHPPYHRFCLTCYKIVRMKYYEAVLFFFNVLSLIPTFYDITFIDYLPIGSEQRWKTDILLNICYTMFFFIFLSEFIIKMCALGMKNYFNFLWNILDFCLLLVSLVDFIYEMTELFLKGFAQPFQATTLNLWLKCIRILYLLRIIQLIMKWVPSILKWIDKNIQTEKLSGYNVAQCVIKTQEEIIKYIQYMSENEKPSFELELREYVKRFEVMKDLGVIQNDYPLVSITVKTKHAIQVILNTMLEHVNALKEKGIIDDMEMKILMQLFLEKNRELDKISLFPISLPGEAIAEITWLAGSKIMCNYLMDNAELLSFQPGEEIISAGQKPQGLFIIHTGLASSSYVYSKLAEHNQKHYGMLPNCDFFMHLNFDSSQSHDEALYPGTVFGELGLLTDRPYDYTVKCNTAVMVSFVDKEHMKEAFKLCPNLEFNMWNAVAIKVASLKAHLQFKKLLTDTLKFRLQNSNMFILRNCQTIELCCAFEYAFLIEGTVEDKSTSTVYTAPTLIAETAQMLTIYDASNITEVTELQLLEESVLKYDHKVDIKLLILLHGDEFTKCVATSDGYGNYRLLENPVTVLCDAHRKGQTLQRQSWSQGLYNMEEIDDSDRRQASIFGRNSSTFGRLQNRRKSRSSLMFVDEDD